MAHRFGSTRDARRQASLYVRPLPPYTKRSEIEQLFSKFGDIRDVYVPLNYYTREPRGFAYVEFEDERDAEVARRELDGIRRFGNNLRIEWAKSDRKTPREMRLMALNNSRTHTRRQGHAHRGSAHHGNAYGYGYGYGYPHNNRNARDRDKDRRRERGRDRDYRRGSRSLSPSRSRSRSRSRSHRHRRYVSFLLYRVCTHV